MPTTAVTKVMKTLKSKGNAQVCKTYLSHGETGEMFGVRAADLKLIAKSIKGEQDLACELYATGNYDAMYLAGLVADGSQLTKKQLQEWVKAAKWRWVSEYVVPWVASESKHGRELALKWIDAKKEHVIAAGWSTYSGLVALLPDDDLDLGEIKSLLKRVETDIDKAPDRARYCMNGFVIAIGSYVVGLSKQAKATAKKLGKVEVDMGGTSCKVPLALEYIEKLEKAGRTGKKRKAIRC